MKHVSEQSVQEWQAHPVTVALEECLRGLLDRRRAALVADFLAGKQDLDLPRVEVQAVSDLLDDIFTVGADDINATLTRMEDD